MFRSTILSLVFILALAFMVSCSSGGGNVVAPGPTGISEDGSKDVLSTEEPGNTVCLGLWQFVADKATGEADLVQLRSADKILNVLGFMEPPPLSLMDLDWPNLDIDFANGTVDVGVKFTHPINDAVFTGFDVRGVVFGPKVTNADGLTIIPSPEFFKGVPFGYQDGLLGAPDSHANYEGLAGYKYFCDNLGDDEDLAEFFSDPDNLADRGKFSPNQKIQRNYHLDWNNVELNFLVFNYAIYANYDWPVGMPPWDVDDWDINTANSAEAFCCKVTELANYLYYDDTDGGGGEISLQVEIWDWQGDIAGVTIESVETGIITETSYDTLSNGGTAKSYIYKFYAVPATPTATGDLDILITVTDSNTFGECWFLDMLPASNSMYGEAVYNCWIHTMVVSPRGIGWARTWGGPYLSPPDNWSDEGLSVAVDNSGNVYVTGYFGSTADFDPGIGTDEHTSNGIYDVFLCKFNSSGNFQWARTWGGYSNDQGLGVAVDDSGNSYVTGYFRGTVDFDPGPGTDSHTSTIQEDTFLSKFDSSGDFQWARTWDGYSWAGGKYILGDGVAVDDSGNPYVTGCFQNTVDFDPGPEIDEHTANGLDIFLSKFDSSGDFQWARTWGGPEWAESYGVAVDNYGNAYVTGGFFGTVDFDPGPGIEKYTSNGPWDIFLSKFNSNGDFQWARTWGGVSWDIGRGVATDDSGNVYVTGIFWETVDFDPGPGVDEHISNGNGDTFISKFDSNGGFQWALTWGGEYTEDGHGIATDDCGNVYVTGLYQVTVDFDPGPGTDNHTSNDVLDIFLSKFNLSGDFLWARTWGGVNYDIGFEVATDDYGNVYATGRFAGTVDFDPGPGTDNHDPAPGSDVFLLKLLPDGYW